MGNVFILNALFSFLGLKRQQPFQWKRKQKEQLKKQEQQNVKKSKETHKQQQDMCGTKTEQKQRIDQQITQIQWRVKQHGQDTREQLSKQNQKQQAIQSGQQQACSSQQAIITQQVTNFVMLNKCNTNAFYHQQTVIQDKGVRTNQRLFDAFQQDMRLFDRSNKDVNNQAKRSSFKKSPFQCVKMGSHHNILASKSEIEEYTMKSKVVILIRQGIQDLKQKNISRMRQVFNLKLVDNKQGLIRVLQDLDAWLDQYPANLICHYSLFHELHGQFGQEHRVRRISVYNSSFMNPGQVVTGKLLLHDQLHKFTIPVPDMQPSGKYHKLGVVHQTISELRQGLINMMVNQQLKGNTQDIFAQFRYFNSQYVNSKHLALKACLLLQQYERQTVLTIDRNAISQDKLRAKLDMICLLQHILGTQFYLEYLGGLLNKQPVWIQNQPKQQTKTYHDKAEQILSSLKQYQLNAFYQNYAQIDKEAILPLQERQQLTSLPTTKPHLFSQSIQKLLFPSEHHQFCFKLILNFLSHSKSSRKLSYVRIFISDLFVAIRQLYKLHDQRSYQGECYCALSLGERQLGMFTGNVPSRAGRRGTDRLGVNNCVSVIQNQNFIIASKNKQKEAYKQGNVLLWILIKKQQRLYQADFGFIQKCKLTISPDQRQATDKRNVSSQKVTKQDEDVIVFNILNTFNIKSVRYDSALQKYVIKMTYGYVAFTANQNKKCHMNLNPKQMIISQSYFNNQQKYLTQIKSQGDQLYLSKQYQQSLLYFQQIQLKSRRQPQINLLKISYAHFGQFKSLRQKKLYNQALQQLTKSTNVIQKIFGVKCHQMWGNIILEAQVYQEQKRFQRAVMRLSTLIHLVKVKAFDINRKTSIIASQQSQDIIELHEIQSSANMKTGALYLKLNKQQIAQIYLKKALNQAIRSIGQFNPLTAQIYEKLRLFYIQYQVYQKSVFMARKQLAILLNIHGQHNVLVAVSYKCLGTSYQKNRQYQLSFKSYKAALLIFEQFYSQDHEQIIQTLKMIGCTLHQNGSHKQAVKYLMRSVGLTEDKEGSWNMANQLEYLIGLCYKSQGDYNKAIQHFQRAQSLSFHLICQNHPIQVETYKQMAQIYQSSGQYQKAIQCYQRPLLGIIRKKGSSHKDVLWYYQKLGMLCMGLSGLNQQLKQHESDLYLDRALEYFTKITQLRSSLGSNTSEMAVSLDNIGRAYLLKHCCKQALGYFQQSLAIKATLAQNGAQSPPQHQGLDFSVSYYLIGRAHLINEQHQQSIQFLNKALNIRLRMLSQSHHQVSQIYLRLGQNYMRLNNYTKCQQLYRKTLSIYLNVYGSSHPQTSYVHYMLGCMYFQKGQIVQKSLGCLIKAIQTLHQLGLADSHKYFAAYRIKFVEIIQYLISKMLQNNNQKHTVLKQLKAVYFNIKLVQECVKSNKETSDSRNKHTRNAYNLIYKLTHKLQQKLQNNKLIPKQARKQQYVSMNDQKNDQQETVKRKSLLQMLRVLIIKLQIGQGQSYQNIENWRGT